jgi:hypothetical protein
VASRSLRKEQRHTPTTESAPDSVRRPAAQHRAFSLAEVAFLLGVPLAWAVLLWFHPSVDRDDVYGSLRDQVATYQIVHVGTLVFIGLMGVALYMLVRDLPGKAARISRLAIGPFVLLYAAYETVIGLATGALVQHANDAPAGERRSCRTPSKACRTTSSWETPASWRRSGRWPGSPP